MNKDNSHSWVRISHGLSKLVTDLSNKEDDNNEQETSEVQFEEYALKLNAGDVACRSKGKAKPQRRDSASSSTKTFPIGERTWTGAIQFSRIKDNLQKHFLYCHHWSDDKWKKSMARGGGNKKRFHYCTDYSGTILCLRALQGHSGRNLIDLSLQDNVVIPSNFFKYIYHVGCAINLHSTTNSGLIAGGQNSSKERQTVFFTAVNPMDEDHKDPYNLHLTKPRLASYKQKKWKRHQDTVCKVHFQLSQRNWFKFYQARCNAIILLRYTPSLLYLEGCCDGIWRYHMPESVCVTSTTADDFLLR